MIQYDTAAQTICLKKDEVYNLLRSRMLSKKYPPNCKFPNEPEFARELGVSRVTLRSAIEKLEENGLVRRFPGRGTFVLEKQKLKRFLLLVENTTGNIESPSTYILPAFERYSEAGNIHTDLLSADIIRSLPEERAIGLLKKEDYDGILLNSSAYVGHEKEIKILTALNKPVLIPHAKPMDGANTGFATIQADAKQAWIDAVNHLAEQGHRNIITLGTLSGKSVPYLREFEEKEYLNFLASKGANPDPGLLHFIPYNHAGLTKLLSELFKSSQSPTAILCFSDFYAMHVYDSLNSLSMKIPDDIAVMGYCGYPGGHMMAPPLSTVDFDYAGIGRMAVDILNSADEWFDREGKNPPHIISPYKLIVRESTEKRRRIIL